MAVAMGGGAARAEVTETDFYLKTTGDLVALCSVAPGDPVYASAIHFCQGFASGAYQAEVLHQSGSRAKPLFCVPTNPAPTRNEMVIEFVKWAKADAAILTEPPAAGLGALVGAGAGLATGLVVDQVKKNEAAAYQKGYSAGKSSQ